MNRVIRALSSAVVGFGIAAFVAVAQGQDVQGESPFSEGPETQAVTAEKSALSDSSQEAVKAASKSSDFCQCVGESESAGVKRIEQALRGPLHSSGLDFTQQPLTDVVAQLQEEYGIPIQLDKAALEAAGLQPDEQLSVNLHNISLRSALRLMLKRLQLTYVIEDEVLMITTPEEAERRLQVCVYDVGNISGEHDAQLDGIVDTIISCVATETWAKNGGGEAEIRPVKPGLLVISQTRAVHEEIRDLLTTIRNVRGNAAAPSAHHGAEHEHAAAEDVVTRSYFLQLNPTQDIDTMRSQVRELITDALPDETWSGRLTDGQPVTLSVFHDRVVVRQTPAVQERVEKILADSGVATPASPATAKGDGGGGGFGGGGGTGGAGGGGGGFFNPANSRYDRARPGFGGPPPAANGESAAPAPNPFQ